MDETKEKQLKKLLTIAEQGAIAVQDNLDVVEKDLNTFKEETAEEIKGVREDVKETKELVNNFAGVERLRGDKGETGEQGDKGDKGDRGKGDTGNKGEQGKQGEKGKDGYTPKKGRDYSDGKDSDEKRIISEVIKKIPTPKDGKDGEPGSPDTSEEIVKKLESLQGEDRLSATAIKNIPAMFMGSSGSIKEIVAGTNITIDNSNLGYPKISSTGGGGNFVPYTGATANVDLGVFGLTVGGNINVGNDILINNLSVLTFFSDNGLTNTGQIGVETPKKYSFLGTTYSGVLDFLGITTSDKTFTFPNVTGTLALTSNLSTFIAGSGVAKITVGTDEPSSPSIGDLWYNTN